MEAMATPNWSVSGQYYETCNCDFVCPCLPSGMLVTPTKGSCIFAMAFQVDRGTFGSTALDGLGFIVVGYTPEAMIKGNWSVGLVTDERATAEQRDAIAAIASGSAGGPMAPLSVLISKFMGVETAPIHFERTGPKWSVKAASKVEMAAEGVMGLDPSIKEPLTLSHGGHPAADHIALAHASKNHVHAFGLSWDDYSGKNNGQYAPFSWKNA